MKLTKRVIDSSEYKGDGTSRDIRWDELIPGFGLRIYPSGKKSFVLSYRSNGRKRLITLNDERVLTLDEARIQARKMLVTLDTEDPLETKRRLAKGESVRDLCHAFLERYAKPQKRSWKDDERRINKRIIPAWGTLKAATIKHADIATFHTNLGKEHPYEANRIVELISKMFELARRWGFVPSEHANPARDIECFKEEKRDRWVTHEELPMLAEAIDEEDNIYVRNALWLYLLTGARKSEILKAKWTDVNFDRRELRLPETKSGRVHYLPLTAPALTLLDNTPRIQGNPYIFPSLKTNSHLVNIDKPWQRVRDRATVKLWTKHDNPSLTELLDDLNSKLGRPPTTREVLGQSTFDLPTGITDVRLHDLRRTVGSWMAQAGNSLHLIGRVLNHSNQATTAIYARFGQDQVRQAMEQHAENVMGVARKKPTAQIVGL